MAYRPLEIEGHFSDPPDCALQFDGKTYPARTGEPLAISLLANQALVLGRSSKYHRPRGLLCGRGSCGCCLAAVDGYPNQRLCLCSAHADQNVEVQNTIGSATFDWLSAIDWWFSQGFDHHHFMTETTTLNRLTVHMARKLAGSGKLPSQTEPPQNLPEAFSRKVEVLIVGAGKAGREVLQYLRDHGVSTLMVDALCRDETDIWGETFVLGYYDDRDIVAVRHGQEIRITPEALVLATGSIEQLPICPGNDTPGFMLSRAAALAITYGVMPGLRIVIGIDSQGQATHLQQEATELSQRLSQAGAEIVLASGPFALLEAKENTALPITAIKGNPRVRRVTVAGRSKNVACDAFIWFGRRTPAYELARQIGLTTPYVPFLGFAPQCDSRGITERPGIFYTGLGASRGDRSVAPTLIHASSANVGDSVVQYLLASRNKV